MMLTPKVSVSNLQRANAYNIKTLMLIRPLFPNNIIPVEECINLIRKSKEYINAVISSGLITTDNILERLELEEGGSDYLADIDKDLIKYIDVDDKLGAIESFCNMNNIAFFKHSIPALNYIVR